MIAFLTVGAIAGIILGWRFNVLILIPATLLALAVVTASDIASRQSIKLILLTAVGTAVLLQLGYIAGRFLKSAQAPTRIQVRSLAQ